MEVLGHRQRGTHVLGAVDQQGGDVDPGEGVAEVLGRGAGHGPEAGRVELEHAGPEGVDRLGRRGFAEDRRQERGHELGRRQIGQRHRLAQALLGDVGGQGPGPAGVGGRQDQCPRDRGVPAVEGQGEDAAERQPGHVRPAQAEPLHEPGQAVGVAGRAERLRRVRGPAGPGGVPGDHREVVAQPVKLGPPGRPAVAHIAVEQDQRRPLAGALVGDAEPLDLDRVHGASSEGAYRGSPGPTAGGRSHSDAWVGCMVWSTTASSSACRAERSTWSRRRTAKASTVRAAS